MDNLLLWIIAFITTLDKREGELIFRWIYDYLGCTKPFRRLWISSLTDEAIRKGLEELKDGSAYDSLYAAADCRAKADWLVGMNASRALAIASGTPNSSIGRVQTPTLAMICARFRENREFVSAPYWQLHITLDGKDITKMPEYRRAFEIGRIFQDPTKGTSANMSIQDNLALALKKGMDEEESHRMIERLAMDRRITLRSAAMLVLRGLEEGDL